VQPASTVTSLFHSRVPSCDLSLLSRPSASQFLFFHFSHRIPPTISVHDPLCGTAVPRVSS